MKNKANRGLLDRIELRKELFRRKIESSLLKYASFSFLQQNKKVFEINSHHELICNALEKVYLGEIKNLIINIPPRYSKTELAVKSFVPWCYSKNPRCNFIHLSYSDSLVLDNSSEIREIIKSKWYQTLWDIDFKRDSDAKNKWKTSKGGMFYAAPTGGQITGIGAGASDVSDDKENYDWLEEYRDIFETDIQVVDDLFHGCFVGGTSISINNGVKRIDELIVGDLVLSYNHKTKKIEEKKVLAIQVKNARDITTFKTSNKKEITCTSDHRFFDGISYKKISELNNGNSLFSIIYGVHELQKDIFKKKKITCVSYRYEQVKQCFRKLNNYVRIMSHNTSQIERVTIQESKRVIGKESLVYDIQIDGNNNFFAEGILAHNCIIIDDPIKPDDAESDLVRGKINKRLMNTIMSRRNSPKKTPIIIIMQRLHEDDMTGFCLGGNTGEHWHHLKIPAMKDGIALWPDKHSVEQLTAMKKADPYSYSGQYDQEPSPVEGAMFKRSWWQIVDSLPTGTREVRGWDLAATKKTTSAYTAGVKMHEKAGNYYISDVDRFKGTPHEVEQGILNTAKLDGVNCKISIPLDPGQAGKVVEMNYYKLLTGFYIEVTPETGSKQDRAKPVSSQCQAGNVYLIRGDWNKEFIEECAKFPNSTFKDQVDGMSRAFSSLTQDNVGDFTNKYNEPTIQYVTKEAW